MLAVVAGMAFLVGLCALIDHVVLSQRCEVFKRLAAEQVGNFQPKIVSLVEAFPSPPRNNVPRDLYDVVKALDNLDFIDQTTLYIPDPVEPTAMWGYTAWRDYTNADGFARFFVAKDFEKAMRRAVDSSTSDLDQINGRNEFVWHKLLSGENGKAKAVVRIDGNSHQSFREYRPGQ
ncbi:MAG: hypothetical protein QME60_05635, partial [Verrucomicrobiota bacterium]|nr:hypothetical protein [Verrucomicrobiota bacterium]